ncbi:MAG TPA: UDP-N-acetylglucosamine diphosphorylase/glucosamine-1-phosphate N-acetyltransferase [Gammaproteobacteria bacterium]|nr:UDP-N-acetylglucosamine diphosphorylase/glucosamine-1-phosphate N-acetyltransferase [Gammaproteobacteria bacterium]
MSTPPLEVIILAAGKGTRMLSALPKVLHELAGKPLLTHVLDTSRQLGAQRLHVVYGFGGGVLRNSISADDVNWVLQAEQNGTGHAVQLAIESVDDDSTVMVLYGDVPMVSVHSLQAMLDAAGHDAVGLMTAVLDDPAAYGRIIRDDNQRFKEIVEYSDATDAQRAVREINTGFLAAPAKRLKKWLSEIDSENAQGEFYLTDIFSLAVADGIGVETCQPVQTNEILGINNRVDLAVVERIFQQQSAQRLMHQGLSLHDPERFDLRGTLNHGQDCSIDINVVIAGDVSLGDRVTIGPNCYLKDMHIGNDVVIQPNCVLEQARIGDAAIIGPYARLRPEADVAQDAHIGNFVEIKKSRIGKGSKVNHLSYVGDSEIGSGVNIGAGVITCNYDGAYKHKTVIGDDAFIGSDTQLVAPVTVGKGATIGAGSTITSNTPDNTLTLSRATQVSIEGWLRPIKKKD